MSLAPPGSLGCLPGVCGLGGLGQGLTKGLADRAASSVLTVYSGLVVSGASWLVHRATQPLGRATDVSLQTPWFGPQEQKMLEIAALLVGPLLAAATIGAVIRQDGRRLVRVFAVGLPVGILAALTAVTVTQRALNLVNSLCLLMTSKGNYLTFDRLGASIAGSGTPQAVQLLVSSLVALAALALWMEMVLRASVIYVTAFFLPVGLAAYVWPTTAHITKRFAEVMVSVIGSKFVIVATLTLGAAAVEHSGTGINSAVTGTAILLLAAFAPFAVLRLVPLVEAGAVAHLEGMSHRPARAAVNGVATGKGAAGLLGAFGGGSGEAVTGGGVRAAGIGERVAAWSAPSAGAAAAGSRPGPSTRGSSGFDGSGAAAAGSRPGPSTRGSSGFGGSGAPGRSGGPDGSGGSGSAPSSAEPGGAGLSGGGQRADRAPAPPVIPAPPPIHPGAGGPDPDGWSDA